MRRGLVLLLALVGILLAASIGYAAYLASRDSVGLPVTKLEPKPGNLAPRPSAKPKRATTTAAGTTAAATTVDDHGGRRDDRSGSGSSGRGGRDD